MKNYGFMLTIEENPWRNSHRGVYTDTTIITAISEEEKVKKWEEFRDKFYKIPEVIAIKKYNEENK